MPKNFNPRSTFFLTRMLNRPPPLPAILAFLVTGAIMAFISWQKWIDPIIDFGEQAYIPWRLAEGDVLYQDIYYYYGPLASYLNALLFKLWGPSLQVLVYFNLLLIAGLTGMIYHLFRRMGTPLSATLAGLGFLTISAFSQYLWMGNHNFVVSYVYDLTYGTFLGFLALFCFASYLEQKSPLRLWTIGLVTGLVFLTKIEIFLAVVVSTALGLTIALIYDGVTRLQWARNTFIFLSGILAPPGGLTLYLSGRMSWSEAWLWTAKPWSILLKGSIHTLPFYQKVMGMDTPGENLGKMVLTLVWILVGLSVLSAAHYWLEPRVSRKGSLSFLLSLLAAAGVGWALGATQLLQMMQPLPLITLGVGGFTLRSLLKQPHDEGARARNLLILVFSAFSFLMMLKIILNVHVYHYGAVLALPAVLLFFKVAVDELPQWLKTLSAPVQGLRPTMALLLVFFMAGHVGISFHYYGMKVFPITEGSDGMVGYHPRFTPRDVMFRYALEYLEEEMKAEDTLAVFPMGAMFNYLTRRKNPTPVLSFNPITHTFLEEAQAIHLLEKGRPTFILITFHDFMEFKSRFFGVDFGTELYAWIQENYKEIKTAGKHPVQDKQFGFLILAAKD
ncbi:MAG: ArnT family glycosyltransferase [Nitrospinaceae bacterium]